MTAIPERLREVLALDPSAPALEFERHLVDLGRAGRRRPTRSTWRCATAGSVRARPVGLMLRNRPAALGTLLGLLRVGACVVTVNPLLGAERLRATCRRPRPPAAARSSRRPRARRPRGSRRRPRTGCHQCARRADRDHRGYGPIDGGRCERGRRAHAHQRHHRPTEADRPALRDARTRDARRQALRDGHRFRRPPAFRRGHRERTARARQRRLPRGAGDARRASHRAARALHRRRMGRRGGRAPPEDREPGAHCFADGARRRRRRRRVLEHPFRDLRHCATRSRPRRVVHGSLRRACAHVVRRDRVRRRRGRLEPGRPRASSRAAKRGSVGRAHAGLLVARASIPTTGADLGLDAVGLLEVRAAQLGTARLGAHHRPRPASMPTASSGSSAAPTRPSCAAGTRCSPRSVRGRARTGARRGRGGGGRRAPTSASARCRWPRSNDGRVPTLDEGRGLAGTRRARTSPRYEVPVAVTVVDALPRTASGKADLAAVPRAGRTRECGGVPMTRASEKWVFGEPPLPDRGRAGRRAAATSPTRCCRSSSRRRSWRRWCRRCATRSGAWRRRRRPICARGSVTTRRRIGACTSTTATRVGDYNPCFPPYTLELDATTATTAACARHRGVLRSATKGRRASCTVASSQSSSTACCRSSTARSGSRARPPSCRCGTDDRRRC